MSLINKLFLGIGAAIVLIVAIVVVWLCLANAHLEAKLAEATANKIACQLANDDFRQKTEQQNQAIAALQKQGADQQAAAAIASREAEKRAAVFQNDAARLAQQKNSGDDCMAAAALLDQYVAGLR
jgi:hypothetical protein